jgi:ketosteroid isomerase-like protein
VGDGTDVVARWIQALNDRDIDAAVSCFHERYRDEAPARRGEILSGRDEVRLNFERLFGALSDLRAEIRSVAEREDEVWLEWRMDGRRADGTPMGFVGVNIFTVADGAFTSGRIYTELERDAGGVDAQIDRMTGA